MKQVFLIVSCISCLAEVAAQKPEKIYGNARQQKPISYYEEQAMAWKKETEKNPKDPNAWYNFYYVNRNLEFNDTTDKRSSEEKNDFMLTIIENMRKNIPESYEYNLCKWMLGGYDMNLLPYLNKAAELGEGRTEHLDYMICIGELTRKVKDRDLYSKKKFEAGLFSTGIIYYNYNVMMGLEQNAILITSGDNDTYPIWYLQSLGIRRDITVINLSLVLIDDYRNKLFGELGINKWPYDWKTKEEYERFNKGIIKHIAHNSKNLNCYVALTAASCEKFTDSIQEKLFLIGLCYVYSNNTLDNLALLKKNIEQLYALDYIDKAFYPDISPDMVKLINGNYTIPLFTLFDHYKLSGDKQKEEWVKSKLLIIAKGANDEKEIIKHLEKP